MDFITFLAIISTLLMLLLIIYKKYEARTDLTGQDYVLAKKIYGAKTKKQLQLVLDLEVSSYQEAKSLLRKLVRNGFLRNIPRPSNSSKHSTPNSTTHLLTSWFEGFDDNNLAIKEALKVYRKAQVKGGLTFDQWNKINQYNVDTYEEVQLLENGHFPSFELYQQASKLNITTYEMFLAYQQQLALEQKAITKLGLLGTKISTITVDELVKFLNMSRLAFYDLLTKLPPQIHLKVSDDQVIFTSLADSGEVPFSSDPAISHSIDELLASFDTIKE